MNATETRARIRERLTAFAHGPLAKNATELLGTLGYQSDKIAPLEPNTAEELQLRYAAGKNFRADIALCDQWQSVDLLFQVTDEDISAGGQLSFAASDQAVDEQIIQSYLFFALELKPREKPYTRTELSNITREINKLFFMPALILFRHGSALTLAIIDRRLSRKDPDKDVLQKVTLIKDIRIAEPHRAHVEILFDLSLERLHQVHSFRDFVELHAAWRKTLDTSALNARFYKELADWYFWASGEVRFPAQEQTSEEKNRSMNLIRLITRFMFCWFIKEKGSATKKLVPEKLFDETALRHEILTDLNPNESTFYKAILQNLFFATLNTEMNNPKRPRQFREEREQEYKNRKKDFEVPSLYRYKKFFRDPDAALELFQDVPFLNGGLFECLDVESDKDEGTPRKLIDGFSDRKDNPISVPNFLFFGGKQKVDLSGEEAYNDSKQKNVEVRGLVTILQSYKFTVEENTPVEEEIALDPELLGQVFENFLAAFVEETKVTARKLTGSFYTPRGVVEYMVDESLVAYLEPKLKAAGFARDTLEAELRNLLSFSKVEAGEKEHQFSEEEVAVLVEAIDALQVLDPACGSGAFPMGLLQKLVLLLRKLDPNNVHWKEQQLQRAERDLQRTRAMEDEVIRESAEKDARARIEEIRKSFESSNHELDYLRKLFLIENSIFGVDIQPIAMQISKLRFFISLIIDEHVDDNEWNRGVRPLPNLETKFVAANSLMIVKQKGQLTLSEAIIGAKREELRKVRERHFLARSRETKRKCRREDKQLRQDIADLLIESGWSKFVADQFAEWDPYNQNKSADFFDAWWMFGLDRGFDIVIANPPYVRQEQIKDLKPGLQERYSSYTGVADLYVYFYENAFRALADGGVLTFISSNKYFRAGYGAKLRDMLARYGEVLQLIDFGDAAVFKAIAYPSILVVRKLNDPPAVGSKASSKVAPINNHHFRALSWEPGPEIEEFPDIFRTQSFLMPQSELATGDSWRLEEPQVLNLLKKLRERGTPLGEYVNGRFYYGIKTGLNEAFVVDRETRDRLIAAHPSSEELLKPFLRGRDVKRWKAEFAEQYLIKIESSENKRHPWSGKPVPEAEEIYAKTYPAIYNFHRNFREGLVKRTDQGHYYWELRSCAYWEEFDRPKILYQEIATFQAFAWDNHSFYTNNKVFLLPESTHYLLAILNSKVCWWFLGNIVTKLQGGAYQMQWPYVEQIPIPSATTEHIVAIEKLAEYILFLKDLPESRGQSSNARDSLMLAYWEQIIDGMVYELFLPEELHAADKHIFDLVEKANFLSLKEVPGGEMETMRAHFERVFDREHPLRKAVFFLDSVESVRIIEGKNQNPVQSSFLESAVAGSNA